MTPEEKAREIVKGLQPWFGSVQDDLRDMMVEEIIAAALREARVEGARKGIEAAADHTEDLFDLCGPFPARKILSDLADAIRALDPEEVVR